MTLEMGRDKKFEYDDNISYDLNFDKWYRWNCREKRNYNQEPYSEQQGRNKFNEIFWSFKHNSLTITK